MTPPRPARSPSSRKPSDEPLTEAQRIEALSGDPNFMTSLARGLTVIRTFSVDRQRMSIAQISARTGISRAAVRRCLYTLGRLGYVESDDDRHFTLRAKILALGHAYLASMPIAISAQPVLDEVSAAVHESCSLATLDDEDIVYVARSSSSQRIMSIDLAIGSRLPAFCTSMGRVLLAALPDADLNERLKRVRITPFTDRTITSKDKLRDVVEATRRTGFAIVDQELEIGLRSIAVPIVDVRGRTTAAINISAQAQRVTTAEMEKRLLPALRRAASELSLLG